MWKDLQNELKANTEYIIQDNERQVKDMKYITVDRGHEDMKWSRIYCNLDGKETAEDIAKAIVSEFYVGKFNKE